MTRIRRKGVAIVESEKGILVVSGRSKIFSLPGGGANKGESREKASIRELREETGLKSLSSEYICSYRGRIWHDHKKRRVRNHTKVFKVKTIGIARPKNEIKHIAWWTPVSKIRISHNTKYLIEMYYYNKEHNK
jgi:8-oxo-dGTP diphosphatase